MTIVTSNEIGSNLHQFLARVASGEEFIIVDGGRELARIIPPERATNAAESAQVEGEDPEENEHPWRGVFVLPRERHSIAVGAPELKPREPSPNFNFTRTEPDHA